MTSRTPTPAEIAGLPFEEEGPMYARCFECGHDAEDCRCWGDFDLSEQNERAREILRKIEGEK